MEEILDSIKPVVENSKFVSINENEINNFINSINESEFEQTEFDNAPDLPTKKEGDYVGFSIVYNTINFCYWGEPKWTIERGGMVCDGSCALTIAFIDALKEGYPLLDPKYLSTIPENDLKNILLGNIEIPLFIERLQMLRKLGNYMVEKFDGSWMNVIKKADHNGVQLVKLLTSDFPDLYKDELLYKGRPVKFYKRAQLCANYIDHDLSKTRVISFKLSDIDKLTAFADYKVPQVLRKFGILEYTKELSEKIDNLVELESGSTEEIEIRANTVEAINMIQDKAKEIFSEATPARIDGILWFRGQKKSPDDKPYHRTRTIWY